MGAWGTAIFSDDLAADVRDEFTDLITDGLSVPEAIEHLVTEYHEDLQDQDESNVFWLALAATQWKLGRLTSDVRDKAIEIIESGKDLRRWENSKPTEIAKRKQHLEKLRQQLVGPQRPLKKLQPRQKSATDFQVGDVAAYRLDDQISVRFCVVTVWGDRGGTYANICLLGLEDNSPFTKEALSLSDTLGPHFTMLMHEPEDRITFLRRGVVLLEDNIELKRAWNTLPVNGWACLWDDFPDALQSILPKTGWMQSS